MRSLMPARGFGLAVAGYLGLGVGRLADDPEIARAAVGVILLAAVCLLQDILILLCGPDSG